MTVLSVFRLFYINRTKWCCCLHLLVFFPFCCFVLNFVFFCFYSSQQKDPPKTGHNNNPQKTKMQKKGQTKKSVSAVVFKTSVLIFWGWATKMLFFWKPYKNRAVSIFEKGKRAKNVNKVELKICPENLSKYVAQHNWTDFQLNRKCFSFYFDKIRILPAEWRRILKDKKGNKRGKFGQIFNSKKGNFWKDFQLYNIYREMYVCIYIYAAGCLSEPHFSLESHETCENVVRNEKKSSTMAPRKAHTNGVQLRTR